MGVPGHPRCPRRLSPPPGNPGTVEMRGAGCEVAMRRRSRGRGGVEGRDNLLPRSGFARMRPPIPISNRLNPSSVARCALAIGWRARDTRQVRLGGGWEPCPTSLYPSHGGGGDRPPPPNCMWGGYEYDIHEAGDKGRQAQNLPPLGYLGHRSPKVS